MMGFLVVLAMAPVGQAKVLTNKILSIVMDGNIPSYEVPVGLGTHFEVWTEKPCEPPSLGDPTVFKRDFDANLQNKNRFALAVIKNIPDRKAHFTLKCEGGLGVLLQVRVVPNPEDAIGLIHVRISDALNAYTAHAVQSALDEERKNNAALMDNQRREILAEREALTLKSIHDRFLHNTDREHGRFGDVSAHVTEQIVIGDRVYLIFRIHNESSNVFMVEGVEVHHPQAMPTTQALYMASRRVEPHTQVLGILGFDRPPSNHSLTLRITNNTGMSIEVDDVDAP